MFGKVEIENMYFVVYLEFIFFVIFGNDKLCFFLYILNILV